MGRGEDARIAEAARWAAAMAAAPELARREREAKAAERLNADRIIREELERAAIERREAEGRAHARSSMAIFRKLPSGHFAKISEEGGVYTAKVSVPFSNDSANGSTYEVSGSSDAEVWKAIKQAMEESPPARYSPEYLAWRERWRERWGDDDEDEEARVWEEWVASDPAPARAEADAPKTPITDSSTPSVFITNYRLRQILPDSTGVPQEGGLGRPIRDIYKSDLSVLSVGERRRLAAYKMLYEDFELFIQAVYCKVTTPRESSTQVSRGHPAFHTDPRCENLLSDFYDCNIPVEVANRGEAEKDRFREWFESNKHLIEDNPEKFQLRAVIEFNLKGNTRLDAIVRPNSGVNSVQNPNLSVMEDEIDRLLVEAIAARSSSNTIRRYGNRTHKLSELRPGLTPDECDELSMWHAQKNVIKEKLITYFQVRYNKNLAFSGSLLEQLGFRPCSMCTPDWNTQE